MINNRDSLDQLAILADQKTVEKEYWLEQLSGEPVKSGFPYDNKKNDSTPRQTAAIEFTWQGPLYSKLKELSKGSDHRLHMILIASITALLNKYTGKNDILLGTPIYKQEVEGRLINTILPLRFRLHDHITFLETLKLVRQTMMQGVKHYRYPMEILIKQLDMVAEPGEYPLFSTALLLENLQDKSYLAEIPTETAFIFKKTPETLEGTIQYDTRLYKQNTLDRVINHWKYLLEQTLENKEILLKDIDILSKQELHQLLYEFNNTETPYPKDKTIPTLFREQTEKTPERTALVGEEGNQRLQITYDCLDRQTDSMAALLKSRRLGTGNMAGVLKEPSINLIVTLLGILKTGGGYVPIDAQTPQNRVISMLEDCRATMLVTETPIAAKYSYTALQGLSDPPSQPHVTPVRPPIKDLDNLPIPNRSLVDYEKYNQYIGLAAVKDSVCLQGTRGCPFKCAYCHKIWPKTHIVRSAQHIFHEVKLLYDQGVRRFSFIDDIFNLDEKNSRQFFQMILQHNMKIQLFFPNGLRGELLSKDYIDLMVEAGTVNISLSLETASPRLQKLIKKNLKIEKLREMMHYLCEKYPQVILDVQTMHGFPTETEEEARMTLDFIKSMKWLHFPYVHILKIYPNTEMEELAVANGISREVIQRSARQGYHELAETLPFDKNFSLQYQSEFLNQYFLSRQRLLHVLPHQMKILTEDEIVQKYNAYLAVEIRSFQDLLDFTGIKRQELGEVDFPSQDYMKVPQLNKKFQQVFPISKPKKDALKILILDLSTFFSQQVDVFYDMIEPPLGPMYLLSYLDKKMGSRITGRIAKSRIDFDSYDELKELLETFHPDVIGVRALTYYKDFFHRTVSQVRQWGYTFPIIAGGPYATSDYKTILKDGNIDLVVRGEGEATFAEVMEKILANDKKLPSEAVLKQIPGIAFVPAKTRQKNSMAREIVILDNSRLPAPIPNKPKPNHQPTSSPPSSPSSRLAYSIFTSGSTGKPKGTRTTHYNVTRVVKDTDYIRIKEDDRILQLSNYAFDGSVFDIYGALLNGAALIMLGKEKVFSAINLAKCLRRENISVFFLTTALFNALVDLDIDCLTHIRKILFGGERVSVEHVKKALAHLGPNRILHMYGPTETTVYATYYPINQIPETWPTIPIGKPLSNTTVYILDHRMKPVPINVAGEIYIGGPGVAAGYQNREELTREKFIPHPFKPNQTLYKTGDLARWLEDGNIQFLDRKDRQVKLRGFRIELGEIERHLLTHREINEVLVMPIKSDSGDRYLCAYITARTPLETPDIKEFLSHEIPEFMVPAYFVILDKMPLNPNGKIDTQKLPLPGIDGEIQYSAPQNKIEKTVAEAWEKVLGREKISIHDNYFEVGGNSLNVIQLNNRLKEAFKREISLATMFRYPTIHSFCEYLNGEAEPPAALEEEKNAAVQPEETTALKDNPADRNCSDEIAVIGMSGRYPGAANIHEFWENLKNGIETISFFTPQELTAAGIEPEIYQLPGYVKTNGGLLEKKEYFDAAFFDYTAGEAEVMVPQMRLFHECVWEALENAGYPPGSENISIGLYAGSSSSTPWEQITAPTGSSEGSDRLTALLLASRDFLCTRISYNLDLKGPAVLINTACSTSLTAVDYAVQALLNGRCHLALAGGVEIALTKAKGYPYQEGMINSPDGHCRAFDANGRGTIGGEGIGIVVLKKLKKAQQDNDHIYGVIKGLSSNNDGRRKVGYTAPSVEGQAEVIRAAQQAARVKPETISYVETHGTGTTLGDPIEIEALKLAFNTGKKQYCAIGSVKTNVGHLNSAAGVTGLIKTLLSLHHKYIPPSLNYETPNPKIDFDNSPFYVNTTLKKWEQDQLPRRAGVSSFGIGGTNVHVILEESPQHPLNQNNSEILPGPEKQLYRLLLLSAKTKTALEKSGENLARYFLANPSNDISDAAYTLHAGRKPLKHRRILISSNSSEAAKLLSTTPNPNHQSSITREKASPIVFLFPGLGAQYIEMGRELYRTQPLFRQEMDRCFNILETTAGNQLKEILYPRNETIGASSPPQTQTPEIKRIEISQPALFAFQYSLARLLITWGIQPAAVMGYSFGEYAAACISGILSLEDALKSVTIRGELLGQTAQGAMMSVPLPEKELQPRLAHRQDILSTAVINGPSCIVSGTPEAVRSLQKELKNEKILCMHLDTHYALHSPLMEPVLTEFARQIKAVNLYPPKIPFISGETGDWLNSTQAANPQYWVRQMREAVRFADGIKRLQSQLSPIFLEIGPGADLGPIVKNQIPPPPPHQVVNLMPPSKETSPVSELRYLLNKLGSLWLQGINIDGNKLYAGEKRRRIPLPTYPFEGKYYWKKVEHIGRIPSGKKDIALNLTNANKPAALSKNPDISQWFYLPSWTRTLPATQLQNEAAAPSGWLIFMDQGGLGEQISQLLSQQHNQIIKVKTGDTFRQEGNQNYIINPGKGQDYEQLIQTLRQTRQIPQKILHLFNCETKPEDNSREKVNEADLNRSFYSLVNLAKALGQYPLDQKITIEVVSTHLQEVTGEEELYPERSLLLGPCTVIPQENPQIRCRSIDIPAPQDKPTHQWNRQQAKQLVEECSGPNHEAVVAIRRHLRWTRSYEKLELTENNTPIPPLKKHGLYLIVGGLGTVGLILAQHLAQEVSARLILTGRSFFPPPEHWDQWLTDHQAGDPISIKINKLNKIREAGAEVMVIRADAADLTQMEAAATQGEEKWGSLNGVIYSAAADPAATFATISRITDTQSQEQFQAKVHGLHVLHELIKERKPDFCMLMSSTSAVLGGLGFVAYAAANAYMDTYALKQQLSGTTRWLSVNWEGWQKEETAANEPGKGFLKELSMTPAEGIQCVKRILAHPGINRVIHSPADLQTRLERWVENKNQPAEAPTSFQPRPPLLTPYEAPQSPLEQELSEIWRNILGIEPIGTQDNFLELGGDSLKAISVVTRIHKQLKVEIPLETFFRNPTLQGLAEYIEKAEISTFSSIPAAEKREYYLLSAAQKRLLILQRMETRSTGYNVFQAAILDGRLDREKLEHALRQLIQRHESFRTYFEIINRQAVQRIHEQIPFEIELFEAVSEDIRQEKGNSPEDPPTPDNARSHIEIENMIKNFVRPFDLGQPPLLRVGLIKHDENHHLLMLDLHHIISDGVSIGVFFQEFMALYDNAQLPPLKLQYRDYSQWQNSPAEQTRLNRQEEFWLKEFRGEIPVLDLPLDYKRPELQGYTGSEMEFQLGREESKALKTLAQEEDVTMYMLLLTLFYILLARISSQEDIVIGTPIEGRPHPDLKKIMGFFVNTLALRNYPEGNKTFEDFLKEVKTRVLKAFAHQKYQFEDLVQKVAVKRDTSRNPLFSVVFNFLNIEVPNVQIPGLKLSRYNRENQTAKFDLTLKGADTGQQLAFLFEYNTGLFKPETIQRFIDHLKMIITHIIQDRHLKISAIPIISAEKRSKLISQLSSDLEMDAETFEGDRI